MTQNALRAGLPHQPRLLEQAPQARAQLRWIINDNYGHVGRMTSDSLLYGPEMTEGTRAFAEKREPSRVPAEFRTGRRL